MLSNPDFQTLFAAFFRPLWSDSNLNYQRKVLETPDDDFIDLDWYEVCNKTSKLVIAIHGLEGSAQDAYIKSSIKFLSKKGFNGLAMNLRSCGGRVNKNICSYHSGKSEDLRLVIDSVLAESRYKEIYILGFSVGGNISLKYLGEEAGNIDPRIKKAVTISPPLDLESSADALARESTKVYMQNLLNNLRKSIKAKMKVFPGRIDDDDFHELETFHDYDERYTAPLNGFESAKDYWEKASSKKLLENIAIPTLIYSALDDPFLGPECFPSHEELGGNQHLTLDYPEHGGHIGFLEFSFFKVKDLYLDKILEFIL